MVRQAIFASKECLIDKNDQKHVSQRVKRLNKTRMKTIQLCVDCGAALVLPCIRCRCCFSMFIWRTILHLPENHEAYAALVEKGTHPAYDKLHQDYPVKSRKLLRVLQRYGEEHHYATLLVELTFIKTFFFAQVYYFCRPYSMRNTAITAHSFIFHSTINS